MILGLPQGFKSTGREAHEYDMGMPPPPPLLVAFDMDDLGVLGVLPAAGAKWLIDPGLVRGRFTFAGGGTYGLLVFVFVFVLVLVFVRGAEWRGVGGSERMMGDDDVEDDDGSEERVLEERAGEAVEEVEADAAKDGTGEGGSTTSG